MPAGHKINAPLAQQGHRGKGAKDAVAQYHIPAVGRPQAVEERLIMVHEGPTGVVHHGTGRQGQRDEFQHGEASSRGLLARLRIDRLIEGSIGQGDAGAIAAPHADPATAARAAHASRALPVRSTKAAKPLGAR